MKDFLTKEFWLDAKERVIRTFVQVLIATLPVQTVATALFEGDLENLKTLGLQALTAALAASLSLLWSLLAASKPNTLSPASSVVVPFEPADTGFLTETDLEEESYHPDDVPPKDA
jgi:hypothetical protein